MNSKWISHLIVKAKTTTLSQKKTEVNFHDLELDNEFLDSTPKGQAAKALKISELDFIKIKNICVLKDIMKKVKRQLTEWEKIFENHA